MSLKMPFGKHEGTPLENLPESYLDWLLDWMDSKASGFLADKRKRLYEALDDEYERRKSGAPKSSAKTPSQGLKVSGEAKALLPEFVKSGYRAMSRKVHPDMGGSAAQMIALQELKAALEELK